MTRATITGIEVVEKAAQPTLLFRATIEPHDKEAPMSPVNLRENVGQTVLVMRKVIGHFLKLDCKTDFDAIAKSA